MLLTAFGKKGRSGLVAYKNTGRMLKILTFILLAGCLQLSANSYSQGITLSVKNAPLEEVFAQIQQQTSYRFIYTTEQLNGTKKINVSVKGAPLEEVLNLCFIDQKVEYTLEDKFIIIREKEKTSDTKSITAPASINVTGKVVGENGEPLAGITVTVKGSKTAVATDTAGTFILNDIAPNATLVFTGVNIETFEFRLKGKNNVLVRLTKKVTGLSDVSVTVSTGYQDIPKERATGSYSFVDNRLINRATSTNVMDRIENLIPGLLFNKGEAAGTDPLLIRGRSTIYANAAPLIVLDNFPYDGDLNNINPNDVESITILKDAAAASIWGARAGNGVIVITSKKGKTEKPQIEFNTNISFQPNPDLSNIHSISSADFIELEKNLFAQGYYTGFISDPANPPLTPAVELLNAAQNGTISQAGADAQIEALKKNNIWNDLKKDFYRTAVNQQYSMNVSGNTPLLNYYLSAGWDHNLTNLEGQQYNRITIRSRNLFKVSDKLQILAGVNYLNSLNKSGNNNGVNAAEFSGHSFYPYAQLSSDKGLALPVNLDYSSSLINNSAQAGLLDWNYRPIDDIYYESNTSRVSDFLINAAIQYRISSFLNAELKYQYENSLSNNNDWHKEASYFARNITNQFTQVDPVSGALIFPLPPGGTADINTGELQSHQGRFQLNYNQTWHQWNQVTVIGGWEIKDLVTSGSKDRFYGYNPDNSTVNTFIDYTTPYTLYNNPYISTQIPNGQAISKTTDRFLSFYANAAYTYRNRYTVSASIREDEANLFGVKTNQKGTPLWSAGGLWELNKESFYKIHWLPLLRLRATYGFNGNISRITSAFTTATYSGANTTPLLGATILNPPNQSLRWEQVGIVNIGLDFATVSNRISGSLEFFQKHAKDLLGQAPVDPTLGLSDNGGQNFFFGNVAAMKGSGIDFNLITHNTTGTIKWTSNFIMSYARTKVTRYLVPVSSYGSQYLTQIGNTINPILGKPVFAVFSYPWAGLDPNTGDPQGFVDGKPSTDYASISQSPLDSLIYNGPAQPVYFGAFRNSFQWKNISLSLNISYKGGYYFRRPSIDYNGLLSSWHGHSDYDLRWQKTGDEKMTTVPSFVYPLDPSRDAFYQYSQILVEKADNIRLEDISLSYELDKTLWHALPVKHIRIYIYSSNLAVIWKANKAAIDPYYNNVPRDSKRIALGMNIIF